MSTDLNALDRRVAELLEWKWNDLILVDGGPTNPGIFAGPRVGYYPDRYSPTRIPAQAMALLERIPNAVLWYNEVFEGWGCKNWEDGEWYPQSNYQPTPCIAITRAFIALMEERSA